MIKTFKIGLTTLTALANLTLAAHSEPSEADVNNILHSGRCWAWADTRITNVQYFKAFTQSVVTDPRLPVGVPIYPVRIQVENGWVTQPYRIIDSYDLYCWLTPFGDWIGCQVGYSTKPKPAPTPSPTPDAKLGGIQRSPRPPYPSQALEQHIVGDVKIKIVVKNGEIINAEGTGLPILVDPTVQWIKNNWKFAGAVNGTFTVPITFNP
jgi:hypothetical protein